MDHTGSFGCQSWLLLLPPAGPAKGLNALFTTEIRSLNNSMAQVRLMKYIVSCLSHLGAAQPQKTQQKTCHYNAFPTFTPTPVREKEGRMGTDMRVGWAALLKLTFWGEKDEILLSWGDARYLSGGWSARFVWQAWSPMLPPSIAHQSAKTFQQITWHFVKT